MIRILSIDGGGIKGAAVVSFLDKLEEYLLENTGKTVLQTFDVFAGTSIGALIIAAIVYGNLSPKEPRDNLFCHEKAKKIMPEHPWDLLGPFQLEPMFDGKGKRAAIEEHIPEGTQLQDTEKHVFFTSYNVDSKLPMMFCSWENTAVTDVRDIIDMSSAAPIYFPIVESGGVRGCDGAIFANNPTDLVYSHVLSMGPEPDVRVLSIGTGYHHEKHPGHSSLPDGAGGIQWMTEGDLMETVYSLPQYAVDLKMKSFCSALNHAYVRVNGFVKDTSMHNISEENIASLKQDGETWWENNKDQIIMDIV